MSKLVILSLAEQPEYELGAATTIGRDTGCTIVVNDALASRLHAEVTRLNEGRYVFVDLNSTHGSFVAGDRITRHVLRDGDHIVIGATELLFKSDPAASAQAQSPAGRVAVVASEPWIQERQDADSGHFPPAAQIESEQVLRLNYDKLRVAYEMGRTLAGEQDLDAVLKLILTTAFRLLPAERAAILLINPATGAPEPYIAQHCSGEGSEIILSNTIINEVVNSAVGIILTDAGEDAKFGNAESVIAQGIRSAMCVPMLHGAELMGIMHLDSLMASGIFTAADLSLFSTIANQGALALKNAALARQVRDEAKTRVQLQRFLSPSLVDQVVSGNIMLGKSARQEEVTVLFSDIRGFTRMSEMMEPGAILSLLNEYFEVMVDVLFRHDGTLDKYVGDALMALFGAPVPLPNAPHNAVSCALEMQARLEEFDRRSTAKGMPPFQIGIGIHTGPAVCGTLGSSKTLQYTAIGDTVNTSARLCSAAAAGQVIISSATKAKLGRDIKLAPLPPVTVKGKSKPLEIFNAVGFNV